MKRRITAALTAALTAVVVLSGCGGSHPSTPGQHYAELQIPVQGHVDQVCSGLTDRCVTASHADAVAADFTSSYGGYSGCKVPDVSSYQGNVDWVAAKPYICGAVYKGGEYNADPYAARNNSELARLHIWRAMYWFVRDTGCDHEANQVVSAARSYGVKVVANDIEVPESYGYTHCLRDREQAAGLIVVTYGGAGTWPGGPGYGEGPLWQAEYGPVLHPFWHPVVAWQCTDGVYGCATYIPGIGQDDVSVDLGLTKLGVTPPDPYALYLKSPFALQYGQKASEYNTVRTWDNAGCQNPVRRAVCKGTIYHLRLLRDRDIWVASHKLDAHGWHALPRPVYHDGLGRRVGGLQRRITAPTGHRCTVRTCG